MRSYGLNGMKAHIRKTVDLGRLFADLVRGRPDLFEIITKPAFGLTVLRVKSPAETTSTNEAGNDRSNQLTREIAETINQRGEIFITATIIAGIQAIRVVSASPQTEESYIRRAFEILVKTAEEVLERGGF